MPSRVSGMSETIAKLSRAVGVLRSDAVLAMNRATRTIERDLKGRSLSARRGKPFVLKSGKRELVIPGGGVGGLAVGFGARGRAPGTLRASIAAEVLPEVAGKVVGVVGTDTWWAPIHEYGGTILPRRGRFLYIPVFIQSHGTATRRIAAGKFPATRKREGVIAVARVRMPKREPLGQTKRRTEAEVAREFNAPVRQFVRVANG